MLNTLFRAGSGGNNGCTLLKFKAMVEGECQNNGFVRQCECQL